MNIGYCKEIVYIHCMNTSTVTSKHQTTIPKEIVSFLGIQPSNMLLYQMNEDGSVTLRAKSGKLVDLLENLPSHSKKKAATIEEMNQAILDHNAESFRNSIKK